jgi:hypothetical protein
MDGKILPEIGAKCQQRFAQLLYLSGWPVVEMMNFLKRLFSSVTAS